MKPAIDQMINWIEGEMAKDVYALPRGYMDKGYRVLDTARRQALKIKERCDADEIQQVVAAEIAFNNAFGAANDADAIGSDARIARESFMAIRASQRIQVSSGGIQVVDMSDADDEAFREATNAAWLGKAVVENDA